MSNLTKRKIIVTVAPVSHPGKPVPPECKNPLSPKDIAEDVTNCYKAGACMVHLHIRDEKGDQTFDLSVFKKTLDIFTAQSDIIVQASTGGLVEFTLDQRCVCLNEPRVEVASLNMGSVNFGESVYINTLPDIRYWAKRMIESKVKPELEHFDTSMVDTSKKLAAEGLLSDPMHFTFCLGYENSSAATAHNIFNMKSMLPENAHWGFTHDSMDDFSLLACALGMGASSIRIGFEDSFNYAPGKLAAKNVILVEKVVQLIEMLGMEVATASEAREILGINKLRG